MAEVVSSVQKCTATRINPVDKQEPPTIAQWSGRPGESGHNREWQASVPPSSAIPFRGHEIPDRNVVMGVSSVPPLTPPTPPGGPTSLVLVFTEPAVAKTRHCTASRINREFGSNFPRVIITRGAVTAAAEQR